MKSIIQNEQSNVQFLQTVGDLLDRYNHDRLTIQHEKKIAVLRTRCEEIERRTELLKQFSDQFFNERKKIRFIALSALDKAMNLGNSDVAEIALSIIGKEYSRDFFGMMNKISGVK